MAEQTNRQLGIEGFTYPDLYDPHRLKDLAAAFDRHVEGSDPQLLEEFTHYRASQGEGMSPEKVSELLVRMAPYLGGFLARLFRIEEQRSMQMEKIRTEVETVFRYRESIVGKEAPKRFKREKVDAWDIDTLVRRFDALVAALLEDLADPEKAVAGLAVSLQSLSQEAARLAENGDLGPLEERVESLRQALAGDPEAARLWADSLALDAAGLVEALYECVLRWTYAASRTSKLQEKVAGWVSFKTPARTDFDNLVEHDTFDQAGIQAWVTPQGHRRRRDGFNLTDNR